MTTVVFTRGGLAESEHVVTWCVAGASGAVLAGDDLPVFARSATKPFQALPAVEAGVLERYGLDDRHLALGCGSHGGTATHTELVTRMLDACGLGEADLGCGPLEPREPAAAAALRGRGAEPTRVTHNCSGKHALALALALARGWPLDGYMDAPHPVQRAMRAAVTAASGGEPDDIAEGTDGCGMSTFHFALSGLAAAFARLASGGLGAAGERVAGAMRAHPQLVAFDGAVDTELMRAVPGLVAKVGAEGVIGIGLADGRGLALKVRDGASRALDPAAVALVRHVLEVAAGGAVLDRLAAPAVLNSRGERVGAAEVRISAADRAS